MLPLSELGEIQYGLMESEDLDEMAAVIGDVFSRFDPVALAIGITAKEVEDFVLTFGPKALTERLTIVACDGSGRLVGAMYSDDLATPPPDLSGLPESFAPVGALLESLDAEYLRAETIVEGSHAHLNMLAVLPELSGKGIAQNLIKISLKNAAERGYRLAVTEATGPISQHIFQKLGFRERFTASYKDFVFDGRPVFSSIESTKGNMLMEVYL